MKTKSINIQIIGNYLIVICISSVMVCLFAFIQYTIIQKQKFSIEDYIIPIIVGAIFGALITRNRILMKHLREEQLQVLEKNKKIHLYIGIIVHDLKSPLSAISGLVRLCDENNERFSDDQKTYLKYINQSANSMLENITNLLDNSRIETGIKLEHLEVGNPYFTIQSTIDKYLIEALNKSISIQRLIDKNLPLVEYDKDLLDRILSNIISNAIKYSPANTQVKIFSEVFAHRLVIIIKDEGLGMSEEDLKNVFQEFKKLSSRPTGAESSSGLGLSITKKLVSELGGEIIARSEGKNKGSAFEITLNIKEPDTQIKSQ